MYQFCGASDTTFGSWGGMFGGGATNPHPINQLSDASAIELNLMDRCPSRALFRANRFPVLWHNSANEGSKSRLDFEPPSNIVIVGDLQIRFHDQGGPNSMVYLCR